MSVNQKKTNIVLTLLKFERLCYNIRAKSVGRFDVKKRNGARLIKCRVSDIFSENGFLSGFAR